MLRKLIKYPVAFKVVKYIIILILVSNLHAQFKDVTISFDDRLLRDDEKSTLFNLSNNIKKFYVDSVWNNEYSDLELDLNIQIIFEGNANTGSSEAFLIQSLFSNNLDLHFFDKGSQFSLNQNLSLYYDSVYYDPLSSLLGFYGNIILGAEIDTWNLYGGTEHYEKARNIAVRANASNFSRGWEQRLLLINILSDNNGLRKLRFSTYLSYELFENGDIDECLKSLKEIINNLNEIYDNYAQENYTNMFMKYHGPKIGAIMEKLGQKEMLSKMIFLDSQRSNIYEDFQSNI
mgnify:CR=1 FL=1|jgi:hypothetical protein|tara:strand:- start:22671 stop:23540 length:870 start_codon:yes stop_codon:yes gene_type:complete